MLIEPADMRQLTKTLVEDKSLWSADALLSAGDSVVHDADRTARLMAAWAQVIAAGAKSAIPMFTKSPDARELWAKRGAAVAGAADQGQVSALEAVAQQCAADLGPNDRARLLERLAMGASNFIVLTGGLDELIEQVALHRRCANRVEARWVDAAAWMVCTFTANLKSDRVVKVAFNRIGHLIDDGHGADLWRTWSQVAASMMSTAYLNELEPYPHDEPNYPVGLSLRVIEAVHTGGGGRQSEETLEQFLAQPPEGQVDLAFELAMTIASCRALPSRRAARRAARGQTSAQDEALRRAARKIMDVMPADVVERTGRMYALSRRAILAFVDGDPTTLAAVIDRVATWDDDPGRPPCPMPRFQTAGHEALALTDDFLVIGEMRGVHVTDRDVGNGAAKLIDRHAPAEHKEAALALAGTLDTGKRGAGFGLATSDSPAGLVAFAATAAWLVRNPRIFPSLERARLNLIKEIRVNEAKALRVPDREMVTDVSDEEALGFFHQLYGPDYPMPDDPDEDAIWVLDVMAVIKQHLLETPADATTADQRAALYERIQAILRAATATLRPADKPDGSGTVRRQPKRTSKRKRK